MNFIIVGINHKYSPIEIREKLYFVKKVLPDALISLAASPWIDSALILSTCNRVELYATSYDAKIGIQVLENFLADYKQQDLSFFKPYLYAYINKEAILHLFKVCCGIDSQIVGEPQILEQVRLVHREAKIIETTNRFLDTVFDKAIKTALVARKETKISEGRVSIASIVIDLIKTKYTSLKDKNILIIGVGKISELVVKYLKQEETQTVFVANRTYQKALSLARHIDAQVIGFDKLKEKLKDTDIIISATSSPHLILKKEDLVDIKKPLLIIDLAVPRDIDPEAKSLEGISLFTLDDLDFIIEENLKKRRRQIPKALEIIEKEVEDLCLREPFAWAGEPVPLP